MPEEPRSPRRRSRGGRRRGGRPQQAPAQPQRGRTTPERSRTTPERSPALRDTRRAPARDARGDRRTTRRGARPARAADEIRPGTPCVILLDCREGEPDRTGQVASFEGFFDFETGEPRRAGTGIPRLRVGEERVWGFECWWRLDPQRGGLIESDRAELEESKRLLRGLMRDARRSPRIAR